jgi:hypothetical protein
VNVLPYPQYGVGSRPVCKLQKGCTRFAADIAEILLKVALRHQKIKSKADYINNHIANVFKYIFNIQLIIKLQSDFLKL